MAGAKFPVSPVLLIVLLVACGCQVTIAPRAGSEPAPPPATTAAESTPTVVQQTPASAPQPSATPTPDWADVLEDVRQSTVRLEISTCDNERGMGSGFVVGKNLVMTAAHVVDQAGSVSLQAGGVVSAARVIHFDYDADVALLQSEKALTDRALTLAPKKPRLGTELAVLGFPNWAQDLRVTRGIVSSLDYRLSYSDFAIKNPVLVTDAAINGGNSGGPVIDRSGQVIGLVTGKQVLLADSRASEGTAFAVPSTDLDDRLADWRSDKPGDGPCGDEVEGDEDAPLIQASYRSDHPDAADITQALALHGESINRGDYAAAFSLFTEAMQRRQGSLSGWSSGLSTSFWRSLVVDDVSRDGNTAKVRVRFTTEQESRFGPDGETCSQWSQTRTLKLVDDTWLIDRVKNLDGSPSAC